MSNLRVIWVGLTPEQPVRWLEWDSKNKAVVNQAGLSAASELETLATNAGEFSTLLLLPGESCLFNQLTLPDKSKSARKAIPYLLEERLCQPVDELHIVSGKISKNLTVNVIAVEHAFLQGWLDYLSELGIHPETVIPDYMMLGEPDSAAWHIVCDEQRVLCCRENERFVTDQVSLQSWWSLLETPELEKTEPVKVWGDLILSEKTQVESITQQQPVLEYLMGLGVANSEINLLQARYELQNPLRKWLVPFYQPIALGALVLMLFLGQASIENYHLSQQIEQYDQAMVELYREVFPEAQRIKDPYRQMKGQLNEVKARGGQSAFLPMLNVVAQELASNPQVKLQKIRFQQLDGKIQLQVVAPSYAVLETLSAKLSEQNLQIKQGAYQQTGDNQISGQLTVWGNNNA